MKTTNRSPLSPSARADGMTLVELMVSITILSLIVVLFSQAFQGVSSAWTHAREKMDNFAKARSMLNRLQVDLQNFVPRDDLPNFGESNGASDLAFYTLQRGFSTGSNNARALSYVDYELDTNDPDDDLPVLLRHNQCQSYSAGSSPSFLPSPTPPGPEAAPVDPIPAPLKTDGMDSIATVRGLLGFSVAFMHPNGEYSPSYYRDSNQNRSRATAITISMVISDDSTASLLNDRQGGLLTKLVSALKFDNSNANARTVTAKAVWDYQLGLSNFQPPGASPKIDVDDYGASVLDGIRTFERTYPLTSTQ